MANGTGTATIDFGAHPGSSKADAFVMADDTSASHTASDHRYFESFASLSCGTPTAGVGFTIYARSIEKLTGTWTLRYVWAD
jgi:hypothetical protein